MAITKLLLSISLWLFGVFWIEVVICKNFSSTTNVEFTLGTEHVFRTNTPNQSLSIKLKEMYIECDKQAHYYTILHKIETALQLRCQESCNDYFCTTYAYEPKKTFSFSPHIFNRPNRFPGLSYCVGLKAGPHKNECGQNFEPCVYYRTYVEPLTPGVLSVFGCQDWHYRYKFNITLFTSDGKNETSDFEDYNSTKHKLHISIDTIDADFLTPDTSKKHFVMNEKKHFAIIDAKMRSQLVCETLADAKSLNMAKCSLNKSACLCGYTDSDSINYPIVCDCDEDFMTKLRFKEQMEFSNLFLRPVNDLVDDLDFYTIKIVPKFSPEILWKVEIREI